MPGNTSVRIQRDRRGRGKQLDAREVVMRQAEAAVEYLRESIINGYEPATGAARPRKPDGKPFAYDTGELADGLRIVDQHQTRKRASVRIVGPASRDPFLAKHSDILTLDGIVGDEMRRAVDDYLEEIDP